MTFLPKYIEKVGVPPIKCQGIKTKLVDFISQSLRWDGDGRWIEPFLGSGVVLFNIAPQRALVSDTNKHIITLYQRIQSGQITPGLVKEYLGDMAGKLEKDGQAFYNQVRADFNQDGDTLRFIFLNRSCFNGIMRFNSKGGYNVPFGHKPERFRQAYITKVVNQISWVRRVMDGKDWEFCVAPWQETLQRARPDDLVYVDPPYIGRHTDYYNGWSDEEAIRLAKYVQALPCKFALSMWYENKYRKNEHITDEWPSCQVVTFSHFYHVGASETLRNEMEEAIVAPVNCLANPDSIITQRAKKEHFDRQLTLSF